MATVMYVRMKCACGATKIITQEEVPSKGKAMACYRCRGIMHIDEEET